MVADASPCESSMRASPAPRMERDAARVFVAAGSPQSQHALAQSQKMAHKEMIIKGEQKSPPNQKSGTPDPTQRSLLSPENRCCTFKTTRVSPLPVELPRVLAWLRLTASNTRRNHVLELSLQPPSFRLSVFQNILKQFCFRVVAWNRSYLLPAVFPDDVSRTTDACFRIAAAPAREPAARPALPASLARTCPCRPGQSHAHVRAHPGCTHANSILRNFIAFHLTRKMARGI